MSQFNHIQDQEPASSVAARIKNAFDYLFNAVAHAGQGLWDMISGNRITPKDNKGVYVENLEIGNIFEAGTAHPEISMSPQIVALAPVTDLLLHKVKPSSGQRLLMVESTGKVISANVSDQTGSSHWEAEGANDIKPKDSKGLRIVSNVRLTAQNDLFINKIKATSEDRVLLIDSAGKVFSGSISDYLSGASNWAKLSNDNLLEPVSPYSGIKTHIYLPEEGNDGIVFCTDYGKLSVMNSVKFNNNFNTLQFPLYSIDEDILRPLVIDKNGIIRIETDLHTLSFYVHDGGPDFSLTGTVMITGNTHNQGLIIPFENSVMPFFSIPHLVNDSYFIEIYARRHGTNLWHPPKVLFANIDGEDNFLGDIILDPIPKAASPVSVITSVTRALTTERNILCRPDSLQGNEPVIIDLPDAGSVADEEIVVRKEFSSHNHLVLKTQGQQEIIFNDTKSLEITASGLGSWLVLVSDGSFFNVVMDKGDWQVDE